MLIDIKIIIPPCLVLIVNDAGALFVVFRQSAIRVVEDADPYEFAAGAVCVDSEADDKQNCRKTALAERLP